MEDLKEGQVCVRLFVCLLAHYAGSHIQNMITPMAYHTVQVQQSHTERDVSNPLRDGGQTIMSNDGDGLSCCAGTAVTYIIR